MDELLAYAVFTDPECQAIIAASTVTPATSWSNVLVPLTVLCSIDEYAPPSEAVVVGAIRSVCTTLRPRVGAPFAYVLVRCWNSSRGREFVAGMLAGLDEDQRMEMHCQAVTSNLPTLTQLLFANHVPVSNEAMTHPLRQAIRTRSNPDVFVPLYLDHGVSPNLSFKYEGCALEWAVMMNDIQSIRTLCARGAERHCRMLRMRRADPVGYAASHGSSEAMMWCLLAQCGMATYWDTQNRSRGTFMHPLALCISNGRTDNLIYLMATLKTSARLPARPVGRASYAHADVASLYNRLRLSDPVVLCVTNGLHRELAWGVRTDRQKLHSRYPYLLERLTSSLDALAIDKRDGLISTVTTERLVETRRVVHALHEPWRIKRHATYSPKFRAHVRAVFIALRRLARSSVLPRLPMEMWLHLVGCIRYNDLY